MAPLMSHWYDLLLFIADIGIQEFIKLAIIVIM
jgi:hypothetical protein